MLRWHRQRIARHWTQLASQSRGRPQLDPQLRRLAIRIARENPTWGDRRIHGELLRLGHTIAASTIWKTLRTAGINPTPGRAGPTWSEFISSQAKGILATDFACVDTVLAGSDITAIRIPPRSPQANAFAERWVRTLLHELLDRTIVWNERQLRQLLEEYIKPNNTHRPHRSINQRAPNDDGNVTPIRPGQATRSNASPPATGSSTNTSEQPDPPARPRALAQRARNTTATSGIT